MKRTDRLQANYHDSKVWGSALDVAYEIGFRAYGASPDVMPRSFEFEGRVFQWQNSTSCPHAKEFRRGYRTAREIG